MKAFILFTINLMFLATAVAQNDTALYFDGVDDYVEIPNTAMNSIGTNDFTYEAYINGDEFNQNTHPIIFSNRSQVGVGSKLFFQNG